jgi:hypothetical protein
MYALLALRSCFVLRSHVLSLAYVFYAWTNPYSQAGGDVGLCHYTRCIARNTSDLFA